MELFLSKEAVKFLEKLSAKEAEKIREKMAALLEAIESEGMIPFNELDIKSLKGDWKGFLRMRVGKNRIIAVVTAVRTGTFLWARSARPQKCPKPNAYGYIFRIDAQADRLQVHNIDFRGNIYKSLRLFSHENDTRSQRK